MSRVLESDDYSTIEVTWDPSDNVSRVDFYHYQVVVDLDATNHSYTLYNTITTNTTVTVVLPIFLYNGNVTFSLRLSIINYCGETSTPVILVIKDIGELWCFLEGVC